MTDTTGPPAAGWGELLGRQHAGVTSVLAGGVAIYAVNEFVTISLLPDVVADIGGERIYAWVTTVYLVASVVAATTVSPALQRFGPRWSYLGALNFFAVGSALCAMAPSMATLLAGRLIQGLAGGMLAGLGYAVISVALPKHLWTRASAVVSAMWGVGTLVGPAAGGLFAQFGLWRWGFGLLAFLAVAMCGLVVFSVPVRERHRGQGCARTGIPVLSLSVLGFAALAVSVAVVPRNRMGTALLLALGVALVVAFLAIERATDRQLFRGLRLLRGRVLPRGVFGPGPLKWIYLTLGLLMAATMADMYVPLFGQRLGALPPVAAGFLGAALSVGWTVGEIGSASITSDRHIRRVVSVAPVVMAVGLLAAMLVQSEKISTGAVFGWAAALVLSGSGIGAAWPHLSAWAMGSVDDPAEQSMAAAAINTVQLICGAFGAGFAGVVVNHWNAPAADAGRWLFCSFAVLAALAWVSARRACET